MHVICKGLLCCWSNRLLVTRDATAAWSGRQGCTSWGHVSRVTGAVVMAVMWYLCCAACGVMPQLRGLEAASRKAASKGRVHVFDPTAVSLFRCSSTALVALSRFVPQFMLQTIRGRWFPAVDLSLSRLIATCWLLRHTECRDAVHVCLLPHAGVRQCHQRADVSAGTQGAAGSSTAAGAGGGARSRAGGLLACLLA